MQNQQNISNQGLAGAYGNQMNQQFGLSDFNRTGMGQDINALGSIGALNQGQAQAQLDATRMNNQTEAYEPYGRLSQYGNALTGLAGGVAGWTVSRTKSIKSFPNCPRYKYGSCWIVR